MGGTCCGPCRPVTIRGGAAGWAYKLPSHISNTVLPTVNSGHMSRIEPAVGNEVAHPFVGPLHLPGCFQIDCPRVPQFSVSIESVE